MKKIIKTVATTMMLIQIFAISSLNAFASFDKPDERILIEGELVDSISKDGETLVSAREICDILGGVVSWHTLACDITIFHDNNLYKPKYSLHENKAYISLNSMNNIFKLESSYSSDYFVTSLSTNNANAFITDIRNTIPTYEDYTYEDLLWLSKIVHAEANGEDYPSKLAVASVILNRVDDGSYPNNIYNVIFDNKHGVQFTPTKNGSIYNTPSTESFLAALETLEGKRIKENALFFVNPKAASSSWVSRNRDFAFTSGNHNFYY